MLASTVQFSTNDQPTTPPPTPDPRTGPGNAETPTRSGLQTRSCLAPKTTTHRPAPLRGEPTTRLFLQDPTGCPPSPTNPTDRCVPHPSTPTRRHVRGARTTTRPAAADKRLTSVSAHRAHPHHPSGRHGAPGPGHPGHD